LRSAVSGAAPPPPVRQSTCDRSGVAIFYLDAKGYFLFFQLQEELLQFYFNFPKFIPKYQNKLSADA
jgi:hypothetical protein